MELPTKLRLRRCDSGEIEIAKIVSLGREDANRGIDLSWWQDLAGALRPLRDEPDSDWDWRRIVSHHQNKPFFRAVSVQTDDQLIQAAMLFQVNALSALADGQPAVYVDRLASAPWNRDSLAPNPVFRGAGTGLIRHAMLVSYSLGFSGRVNLTPVANEDWYANRGFIATDVDRKGETVFEISAEEATRRLVKEGFING